MKKPVMPYSIEIGMSPEVVPPEVLREQIEYYRACIKYERATSNDPIEIDALKYELYVRQEIMREHIERKKCADFDSLSSLINKLRYSTVLA
jgi:hypothetical protein